MKKEGRRFSSRFRGPNFWRIEIFKKYPLSEIAKAHQDLEGRKILGPAVIIP